MPSEAEAFFYCLLGFRTAVDFAGEARNPQRNVPLAMGLGLGISLLVYLVLQWSFLLSVPPEALQQGGSQLSLSQHGGPLAAIALSLELGCNQALLHYRHHSRKRMHEANAHNQARLFFLIKPARRDSHINAPQ